MRILSRRLMATAIATGLAVTAVAPAVAQDAEGDWPNSGTLADGSTFTLHPRVAEKLATLQDDDPDNDAAINYVFSYGSDSIASFSPQYRRGYERSIPEAQAVLPQLSGTAIAPASARQDINQQIAQIDALFQAGLIDCLSIQTTGTDGFTKIVNDIMATGIPVWTVGVQSNGNELTNFTQISMQEGREAAQIVWDWMQANDKDITNFAVSGGDPSQNWAQGRMRGFIEEMTELHPDAVFLNDADSGLNTTYFPAETYDAYRAFIQGNPEVQLIENVDIGAAHANRAIVDADREGEIFSIGWNVDAGQLDGVERGIQVAALDQKWGDQAAFGATACAEFLTDGTIHENTQKLVPVTQENVEAAREEFFRVVGE